MTLTASNSFGSSDASQTVTVSESTADGLIAWYRLDGNAVDSSGNGYNGSVHDVQPAPDRYGTGDAALLFDGDGDKVTLIDSFARSDQETYALWVKPLSVPSTVSFLFNLGYDSAPGSFRLMQNADRFRVHLRGDGQNGELLSPFTYEVDRWYHLAYVRDGDSHTLYVDGLDVASVSYSQVGYSETLELGAHTPRPDFPYWAHAVMDDARVYNRALDAQEISDLAGADPCASFIDEFDGSNLSADGRRRGVGPSAPAS